MGKNKEKNIENEKNKEDNSQKVLCLLFDNVKHLFVELGEKITTIVERLMDKLMWNAQSDNSARYEAFTPASEIENGEEYIKALEWALKNKNVKNIALTGPYGSGKSSIIQSYLKKHSSTKALNISLATFNMNESGVEPDKIEESILKQLFYKANSKKLPQSRYRKLRKKYYRRYLLNTIVIAFLSFLAFKFFFPGKYEWFIDRIVACGGYYKLSKKESYTIALIFASFGLMAISYIFKWIATHFKVKEVKIADKATASMEESNESVFNKNMDEIVYFFEETSYDTVFIEDLDRFDSCDIFVRLRELNTILNNYDLIKRRIVFVYAIKDEMFVGNERTKFFDFIVPVIPVINATNSGEILRKKLSFKEDEMGSYKSSLYDISNSYITQISPFIGDMRVLTSICNEFIVYKNTLKDLRLKDEEMFSMMVFKNLYPSDFAELESEGGVVKRAFEDKKDFACKITDKLRKHNTQNKAILDEIEEEILNDVRELKAAFMDFLVDNKGPFNYCYMNNTNYSYAQIMQPDFDLELFNCNIGVTCYYYIGTNGSRNHLTVNDLKKKIDDSGKRFLERLEYLENSKEKRQEKIRKEIEENENKIMNVKEISLKSMIEMYGESDVLSTNVLSNDVLRFFLKKGYINESYADYINYFHPNSITSNEMNYIRGIRMGESVGDFSYPIKNVSQVCDRIEDYEFKQKEALNYDVVDYLITNKEDDVKCRMLFEGLANGADTSLRFIKEYIGRNQNISTFINRLCRHYPLLWNDISVDNTITEDAQFKYLSLFFSYATIEDIVSMNQSESGNVVEKYVLQRKNSLAKLNQVNTDKMISIIEEMDWVFVDIDIKGINSDVLDYIFNNKKYALNTSMVTSLFEYKYPNEVEKLKTENYSTVLNSSDEVLLEYVHENFVEYVTDFVLDQTTNINENIYAIKDILERLYIDHPELCKKVIDKEKLVFDELPNCRKNSDSADEVQCEKVIWDYVLDKKKLKPLWKNYNVYYDCFGLSEVLLMWFDEEYIQILSNDLEDDVTDDVVKELLVEDISRNAFVLLIKRHKVKDFDMDIHKFTPEQIDIMVDENYIPFDIAFINDMQEKRVNKLYDYIIDNKDLFIDQIDNISLAVGFVTELMNSQEFDDGEKQKLFALFTDKDVDEGLALAIREQKFKISKIYVDAAWAKLEEKDRYQLLLNHINVYTLDELSEKLSLLAPDYRNLADRSKKHKEFLHDDKFGYNKSLLEKLYKRGYLSSVELDEHDVHNPDTKREETQRRFVVWVRKK